VIEPKVWVFFYGSYINLDVLAEVALVPEQREVARLSGFELRIAPRANLLRSDQGRVYGLLATATHRELERLYAHSREVLGETYLPEAVLVETLDGRLRPAMTYICPEMIARPPDPAYVERITGPARRLGFPDWYVAKIESFRS
jgi:hypothetical protein